jgi:uncharacterized damage-inducible protein DinB
MTNEQRILDPYPCREPEIGRWLAGLQDARQRTLRALEDLSPATLDWPPPDGESSIGTVLYHLADIEADYLYVEVLERPMPPEYVLYHLMQHEAEHRSQIGTLRARAQRHPTQG